MIVFISPCRREREEEETTKLRAPIFYCVDTPPFGSKNATLLLHVSAATNP